MPNSPWGRAALIFAAGLVVLLIGAAAFLYNELDRTQQGGAGVADIGGPFTLVDQNGVTRTDADFRGKYLLVYFGYTYCPDVCPTTLSLMGQALDLLAEQDAAAAARVVPIFITVDPERDTVEAMKSYAEHFHPDLVALTGSAEQVATAAKAYRVFYRKVEDESATDYLMDHSSFIFLMDPEGNYSRHFAHNATPEEIAEALRAQIGG